MAQEKKEDDAPRPDQISVDLRWGDDKDLSTLYANNLHVTHQGGQFYLVFGEITPPLIVDFKKEAPKLPREWKINPLVRIAVTPQIMARFADAIKDNFEKFLKTEAGKQKEGGK